MKNRRITFWRNTGLLLWLMAFSIGTHAADAGKSIYIPSGFGDANNEQSQYCYARSKQSDNFIVFWQAGYGNNPQATPDSKYRVNVDAVLKIAEDCFKLYTDSLKFTQRGKSKTDQYKMIILLEYSTTWKAEGSGRDNVIGLLTLSANAGQALGVTVAHEVGHCFQYQVHCDGWSGGWMYGFGENGAGGNCFWEQCAQWQAFKNFPEQQFTDYRFSEYLNSAHKHILHETPRYANYFIQDYWCYLHGMDMIGRLWRESKSPEDPVEAYIRLTKSSQSSFNDEIYECAARFTTWDVPALRSYGESRMDARPQCRMNLLDDGYWQVDSMMCLENYGYNVIKLNAPSEAKTVKMYFEGQTKQKNFRSKERLSAGWRYGFVALLKDGTRVYGDMHRPSDINVLTSFADPKDTIAFDCPDNCSKLWFVITGAPKKHWRHAWDDTDRNDEQWPYKVKFEDTNLYGVYDFGPEDVPHDATVTTDITLAPVSGNTQPYPSTAVQPSVDAICRAFCLSLPEVQKAIGSKIIYNAVNPNGTLNPNSTANAPGHWFNNNGAVTTWGNNSYIFSELNTGSLTFNIGQYPNKCKKGDKYTIRQALVYKPAIGKSVQVTFVFNIGIGDILSGVEEVHSESKQCLLYKTVVTDVLQLTGLHSTIFVRDFSGRILKQLSYTDEISVSDLPSGFYLVTADGTTAKFCKQ